MRNLDKHDNRKAYYDDSDAQRARYVNILDHISFDRLELGFVGWDETGDLISETRHRTLAEAQMELSQYCRSLEGPVD